MGKQFANLHQPFHPDRFIYYDRKKRKYNALRRIEGQKFKGAVFFTFEEALAWFNIAWPRAPVRRHFPLGLEVSHLRSIFVYQVGTQLWHPWLWSSCGDFTRPVSRESFHRHVFTGSHSPVPVQAFSLQTPKTPWNSLGMEVSQLRPIFGYLVWTQVWHLLSWGIIHRWNSPLQFTAANSLYYFGALLFDSAV